MWKSILVWTSRIGIILSLILLAAIYKVDPKCDAWGYFSACTADSAFAVWATRVFIAEGERDGVFDYRLVSDPASNPGSAQLTSEFAAQGKVRLVLSKLYYLVWALSMVAILGLLWGKKLFSLALALFWISGLFASSSLVVQNTSMHGQGPGHWLAIFVSIGSIFISQMLVFKYYGLRSSERGAKP